MGLSNISRFVVWICRKFSREEIEKIVIELSSILKNPNADLKTKDQFKEEFPHFRDFRPDPLEPLTQPPGVKKKTEKDYKVILKEYQETHNKPLQPVNCVSKEAMVPSQVICPHCNAPHQYIYFNDGKKRSQLLCKVCNQRFQLLKPLRKSKTQYYCPYCNHALFLWKKSAKVSTYKCCNDNCPHRIEMLHKLKSAEKILQKLFPNHFKINYQSRQYHLTSDQYQHAAPKHPKTTKVDLLRIHKSDYVLGLVLACYVSFSLSARKTAFMLRSIFNIPITYQTVLNYAKSAAYYAHQFNLKYKGPIDDISVGDETYISVCAKEHYVWFFLSSKKHSITAYHLSSSRDTIPALASINQAISTAKPDQPIHIITDGLGSYVEAIQFLNKNRLHNKIKHSQVIGLENHDDVSEEYRHFKQLIERLNRTFKQHVKPSAGFNSFNGAMALTTLFVTYYNFLRPHMALGGKSPVHIPQLDDIKTIQAKWVRLLSMVF
jgi:putative transposase